MNETAELGGLPAALWVVPRGTSNWYGVSGHIAISCLTKMYSSSILWAETWDGRPSKESNDLRINHSFAERYFRKHFSLNRLNTSTLSI